MKRQIVICDIDGTLADCAHRRHFVESCTNPSLHPSELFSGGIDWCRVCDKRANADWDSFLSPGMVMQDAVVRPIRSIISHFAFRTNYAVVLCTGRAERHRDITLQWLNANDIEFHELLMRSDNDFRPDDEVKQDILNVLGRENVFLVIDDRASVVKMWRRNGLFTLDVAGYAG